MKRTGIAAWVLCAMGTLVAPCDVNAAGAVEPYQEYSKLIRVAEQTEPLTSDLFGESINLYNGQTEFANVDIDIPGNGGLPVQLRRRLSIAPLPANAIGIESFGGFGNWDVDIPFISGVFDARYGWEKEVGGSAARCSSAFMPATSSPFRLKDIFSGVSVHIPSRGDRELMLLDSQLYPTDGAAHVWTTREMDAFNCTTSTKNGYPGEGFVMRTADGVKYTFDVGVTRNPGSVEVAGATRPRVRVYLLASRVEDRFGNWVSYAYDGSGKPLSINASDGRSITLSYTNGVISSATANGKQWVYNYQSYSNSQQTQQRLVGVKLPDASAWSYAYDKDLLVYYEGWDGNVNKTCSDQAPGATGNFKLRVTHPSGAAGEFSFAMQRHYRDGVSVRNCLPVTSGQNPAYYLSTTNYYDVYSLTSKTLSGAGIPSPQRWTYGYADTVYGLISGTEPCNTCTASKTVEVIQPDGSKLAYRFGAVFSVNDGKLLGIDTYAGDGARLRSESREYMSSAEVVGQPFPSRYGIVIGADDLSVGQVRPLKATITAQSGDTFTSRVEAFNAWAQPTQVRRFSSLTGQPAVVETTSYINDRSRWLLGLIERNVNAANGEIVSRLTYDGGSLLPTERWEFERSVGTYTYNAQGLIASIQDGNGRTTRLDSYKRGIPQSIVYADGTSQSATVDDNGKITRVVDQAGNATAYGYDNVGRLINVTYPSGDVIAWLPKSINYDFVSSAERGVAAGHWRRTLSRGDAREVTYFDALLRPVLRDTYLASIAGSHVTSRADFNWRGEKVFESFPVSGAADLSGVVKGAFDSFDALGRVTRSWQDSERGQLTTVTGYLSGGGKRVTDPLGKVTDIYYQMFDKPSYDVPVSVQTPEGISQYIDRDVYGNALSITQAGSSGSLTRTLVYDAQKRLCRVFEPENGSRVMDYDGANNLAWSAAGLGITGTGCAREQVAASARTNRGYDARNRLVSVQYPAGTESLGFTYDALGAPLSAASGATRWTYARNKLGLVTSETLSIDGNQWALAYGYAANGSLSSIRYPDGKQVDYAPDGLGRPTRVGGYAANVSYFPDGDLQSYTLGNGGQYLAQKNVRGFISNFSYAKGSLLTLSEDFTYDANGNTTAIGDLVSGLRSKTMRYDAINRVLSVDAPKLWGSESFTYDTLNNIRSMTLNGSQRTLRYSSNNLLTSVTAGAETLQSYSYDTRGNAINKNGFALVFDQADRLVSVQDRANYNYDAAGRRVKKRSANASSAVYYAYNQAGQLMFEYGQASAQSKDYIYLGKKLIAYTGIPTSRIAGQVEGVTLSGSQASVKGWTCLTGSSASVQAQLYVGGENGTYLGAFSANVASGSDIALRCRAAGTAYRFDIPVSEAMRVGHAGKAIYIYGATTGGDKALLAGSGNFVVPAWTAAPPAPAKLDAILAGDFSSLNVSWPSSSGATSYQLEQSFNGDGWASVLNGTGTSWSRSQPGDGRYGYHVRACSSNGCSLWTNSAAVTVTHPPATPASIQVPATSGGAFIIQWSSAAYTSSYVLEQSINGGGWAQLYNGAATQYAAQVSSSAAYTYRVKGCNATTCGSYATSSAVAVTIPPSAAPAVSVSNGNLTGAYTVSWTAVAGAATYTLQEQANGGGWGTVRADGVTSWVTSGRGAATYGYRVQACNAGGCGPWSATASLVVTLRPAPPSLTSPGSSITVPKNTKSFSVIWTPSAGATYYEYALNGSTRNAGTATSGTLSVSTGGYYDVSVRACASGGCSAWTTRNVAVYVQGEVME